MNIINYLTTNQSIKPVRLKKTNPLNFTTALELYRPYDRVVDGDVDSFIKSLGL